MADVHISLDTVAFLNRLGYVTVRVSEVLRDSPSDDMQGNPAMIPPESALLLPGYKIYFDWLTLDDGTDNTAGQVR